MLHSAGGVVSFKLCPANFSCSLAGRSSRSIFALLNIVLTISSLFIQVRYGLVARICRSHSQSQFTVQCRQGPGSIPGVGKRSFLPFRRAQNACSFCPLPGKGNLEDGRDVESWETTRSCSPPQQKSRLQHQFAIPFFSILVISFAFPHA